ncbi:hypothetical protein HHI36_010192 [Cryptolaemus montrouzieri]|uniref:Uncharacterized protein n=1 Tax=Cryptolaemus montrouzieri TaxID=559131 RepID=A0ABD2MI27_9CUCU
MMVTALFENPFIPNLWKLEVLGIQAPSGKKTKAQVALAVKQLYLETVTQGSDKRYEGNLPWLEGHPPLPTNYNTAKKRLEIGLVDSKYLEKTVSKLQRSFYVDNCVTSLLTLDHMNNCIRESINVMKEAQFELRGWEVSGNSGNEYDVPLLGLVWFPKKDVLTVNHKLLGVYQENLIITKRKLSSLAQKVFDPVGFTSPATLLPKLWL